MPASAEPLGREAAKGAEQGDSGDDAGGVQRLRATEARAFTGEEQRGQDEWQVGELDAAGALHNGAANMVDLQDVNLGFFARVAGALYNGAANMVDLQELHLGFVYNGAADASARPKLRGIPGQ